MYNIENARIHALNLSALFELREALQGTLWENFIREMVM